LSSDVLKLMRKGVKGLQNIQLLKWCKELGVRPWWNFLWGFPGESPAEYERMAEVIPLLTHLQPPLYGIQVMLHRFSPNFDHAEEFGFTEVTPFPSYFYVYQLPREAVSNLAYHFTFSYRNPQPVEKYTAPIIEQIDAWREAHESSELFARDSGNELEIWDFRPVAHRRVTVLEEPVRSLYLACDHVRSTSYLRTLLEEHWNREVSPEEVERIVEPLIQQKLAVREGNSYLGLAVLCGEYRPPEFARQATRDVPITMER
jgi:(2Fe-2S) ferredoxin